MVKLNKINAREVAKAQLMLDTDRSAMREGGFWGQHYYAKAISAAYRCSSKSQQQAIYGEIVNDDATALFAWRNETLISKWDA